MIKRTVKTITRQEAESAAALFGMVPEEATDEGLRKAWRDRVRNLHPDTLQRRQSPLSDDEATAQLHKLTLARARLLVWLAQQPSKTCKTCNGRGAVRSGPFATKPCPNC